MTQLKINFSEEQQWVSECLSGNTGAFRFIVKRHERLIRSMIYRLVDDEHEVEEIAQQTFIAAYQALKSFSGQSKLSTWLSQIALNKARDYRRKQQQQRYLGQQSLDDMEADIESGELPLDHKLAQTQVNDSIQQALLRLKPQDRELVTFKYILGHDYDTVAEILDCTPGAAKVRSVRARDNLKKQLQKMGIEP